jgi:hypothetical protein
MGKGSEILVNCRGKRCEAFGALFAPRSFQKSSFSTNVYDAGLWLVLYLEVTEATRLSELRRQGGTWYTGADQPSYARKSSAHRM